LYTNVQSIAKIKSKDLKIKPLLTSFEMFTSTPLLSGVFTYMRCQMASIKKRGNNKYTVTVSCGYDRNNKKIAKYKTSTLSAELTPKQQEKEIQRLAAKFEEEVKNGQYININLTFEQFTEQWFVEYGEGHLERTTIESYKGELRTKINPAIGHIKLKDLKPLHLMRFYRNLTEDGIRLDGKEGGYSTRIIKYQHSIISSILQSAVYWQILNDNVARRVQPPKGNDKSKGDNFLDEVTTAKFLHYVLETETLIYQAMAFVTIYGSMRKGEILGINWTDISFEDNTIRIDKAYTRANREEFVKSPKNKSSNRVVAMPSVAMKLLDNLKQVSNDSRVFPLSYSAPTQWFERIKQKYNAIHHNEIPSSMTYHGLRHTSASLLIAQGMDVKTVSARLGHTDAVTTLRIYSHYIRSRDEAASEALSALLNNKDK